MSSKPTWSSFVVAAVALAAVAVAQEGSSPPVFLDTTEVNVINVDVVVTDRDGRPVTGLRAEDFVLLEDGAPKPISNFFAIENGRSVSFVVPNPDEGREPVVELPPQPVHLVLYIDNANISPTNRRRVLIQIKEFLRESWTDSLRVALISNDFGVVIHQGFTNEQRRLFAALDRLESNVAVANSFDFEENSLLRQIASVDLDESRMARGTVDTPTGTAPGAGIGQSLVGLETNPAFARLEDEALSLVPQLRAFAGMRHEHLQRGLGSMRRLVDAVAGVPGRKSVIYLSDGIELRPGELLFDSFWRRFRKLPKISGHFSPVVEVGAYDLTGEYLALIAEANAARVTFYPLNSSLPVNLERNSAASTARPTRDMRDWDARFSTTEADARESMMRLLADGTGGRTAASIAPVEPVLAASLDDFENYYSLGYQIPPDDERLGEQREFEVQTKLPGLRVRYRRSGVDKSADSVMVEKTMSGLLIDVEENPLEVVLHTEPAKADGEGVFVVPISVELPMARLVLMPAEEVHQAQVALFVAVLDGRQRTSEVSKNLCPIRIRNDQLASSLSRPVSCGLRLRMRSGPQRVSIGVRDELAAVDSVVSVEVDVGADVPVAGGG